MQARCRARSHRHRPLPRSRRAPFRMRGRGRRAWERCRRHSRRCRVRVPIWRRTRRVLLRRERPPRPIRTASRSNSLTTFLLSSPGSSRRSRLGMHRALLIGMAGTSPAMTRERPCPPHRDGRAQCKERPGNFPERSQRLRSKSCSGLVGGLDQAALIKQPWPRPPWACLRRWESGAASSPRGPRASDRRAGGRSRGGHP